MPDVDIEAARYSDMTNRVDDYAITALDTDGISEQKETTYTNDKWTEHWGYFNTHPELKSAILMKAIWNVGKGYTADNRTRAILDNISGWGKDCFEDVLFNMEVCRRVGRDSFSQVIRNDEGTLINLKCLNPGVMRIVCNGQGLIERYEQLSRLGNKKVIKKFKPAEIFHLSNNRLADQIHGISDIESLDETILAELESFKDIKQVMHRQAKPFIIFKLGTDETSKIDTIVKKIDELRNKGEDLYIPDDEDIISFEVVQVNMSSVIMEWRNDIRNKFYRTIGLPQIVPGAGGQSTESESKVIYYAFENIVERDQRYIENQVWQQLKLRINLIPPKSLMNEMSADQSKDAGSLMQQSDLTAGRGR